AQIILTADQAGELRLTLRAKNDGVVVPLPTSTSWSMVGTLPGGGPGGGTEGPPASEAGAPQSAEAQAPETGARPQVAGNGQPAGAPQATGPKLPKQPYVEVIRGNATEIVVPQR
ncbi:MAG: hypothetical protein KKI08_21310, partial [Armatimonadetes bacterium]|nr:hypothetical protein [Armatimonadota bacterium]